jgi:hypothetical protein
MEQEKKVYHLSYNRLTGSVIVYTNSQDAERGGGWYRAINALDLKNAKLEFLELYREYHEENE